MIELQPFAREDFSRLISWVPSAEFLMQWAGFVFTYPLDEQQLESYLQSAEANPEKRCIWKVVKGNIVDIELNNIYDHDQKADLCRVLIGSCWRGRGLGKQMVTNNELRKERIRIHLCFGLRLPTYFSLPLFKR